jgi:ankyrin repeat protein
MAVMIQNLNLVKLLIKYGADVNLKEYNDVGEKTPLHYAVEKNNFEITNFLLDNGANPTIGDKRQMSALHYAARFGFK